MKDGYGIAVYEISLAYGGPEEGGWYYETGDLVHTESGYLTEDDAIARAAELREGEYKDTGDVYSVIYRNGAYSILVTDPGEDIPQHYPEETPRYE